MTTVLYASMVPAAPAAAAEYRSVDFVVASSL